MRPTPPLSAIQGLLTRFSASSIRFDHPAEDVRLVQTHISVVVLAGEFAYKMKKPVRFPFVDYSTLEKREAFCRLEVELNRCLASEVYLGVVPLTLRGDVLEFEGNGEPVEFAVKMRRLPDDRRLNRLLESGGVAEGFWTELAEGLARFYRQAEKGPEVSAFAQPGSVQEDWKQVFDQVQGLPREILEPVLLERLRGLAGEAFERQKERIQRRAPAAREGHGDLRLEHIYSFPDRCPPLNLAMIDRVEFSPRFRCCDPMADIAFLVMDLEAGGYHAEARQFTQAFLKAQGDEGGELIDFYIAYRHLVRGMVRGLQWQDASDLGEARERAGKKARLHFLKVLDKLETPFRRPCLVLFSGLPGAGKSSLAHLLQKMEGFRVFSSDIIRKELAGRPVDYQPGTGFSEGLYGEDWTEKTYSEMMRRATSALLKGQRVVVDASFWRESRRESYLELAKTLGVPMLFFVCKTSEKTARQRLGHAQRYGSDADYSVYRRMAEIWESPSPVLKAGHLDMDRPLPKNFMEVHRVLEREGLAWQERSRLGKTDGNFDGSENLDK